ncbi:MAG: copper homeostasis protein CutC [Caldilineaceae bacterium]
MSRKPNAWARTGSSSASSPDGDIDVDRVRAVIDVARPLSVTFHRAFDVCDPFALERSSIWAWIASLTSGQEPTTLEEADLIAELVRRAGDRIIIMAGGGINERNVDKIIAQTGVKEIHVSARSSVDSAMTYRNTRVFMGGELRPPEYSRKTTDAARVRFFAGIR